MFRLRDLKIKLQVIIQEVTCKWDIGQDTRDIQGVPLMMAYLSCSFFGHFFVKIFFGDIFIIINLFIFCKTKFHEKIFKSYNFIEVFAKVAIFSFFVKTHHLIFFYFFQWKKVVLIMLTKLKILLSFPCINNIDCDRKKIFWSNFTKKKMKFM